MVGSARPRRKSGRGGIASNILGWCLISLLS